MWGHCVLRQVMLAALAVAAVGLGQPASGEEAKMEGGPAPAGLAVGERAPDFALKDTTGKKRTLAEFRGKEAVALAFYPAMFEKGG